MTIDYGLLDEEHARFLAAQRPLKQYVWDYFMAYLQDEHIPRPQQGTESICSNYFEAESRFIEQTNMCFITTFFSTSHDNCSPSWASQLATLETLRRSKGTSDPFFVNDAALLAWKTHANERFVGEYWISPLIVYLRRRSKRRAWCLEILVLNFLWCHLISILIF